MEPSCKFCEIASRVLSSAIVFEDSVSLAFLDNRPLFPGHTLLIPKQHFETLEDLPAEVVGPFFTNVQVLARAVESSMNAEGSFVAINNRVSQSVPHLHVHVVPRYADDPRPEWPFPFPEHDPPLFPDEQMRSDVARLRADLAGRS